MDGIERRARGRLDEAAKQLMQTDAEAAQLLRAQSFQVYLSDPASVERGGVYFCGLKPYGRAGAVHSPPSGLPKGYTTYRDQASRSPFYPRAVKLIRRALDLTLGDSAVLEAALCTNWYFQRAADTKQLKHFGLERLSMADIHRELLDLYSPKAIVCIGNGPVSAYAGMLKLLGRNTTDEVNYIGNSYLRASRANEGEAVLLGFPHLSRYPVEDTALRFMREMLSDH